MPQRRKTKGPTLPVIGGLFTGVIASDPDGHQEVLPFSGDGTVFLSGEGTFITVTGGEVSWGSITGDINLQLDLQAALDAKQDQLVFDTVLEVYCLDANLQPTK